MARLAKRDSAAEAFPVTPFAFWLERAEAFSALKVAQRAGDKGARPALRAFQLETGRIAMKDLAASLARTAFGSSGFRERLELFWSNHFAVEGRNPYRVAVPAYVAEAIRPNLTGPFSELLRAAVLHPMMLKYLNQNRSVGPTSPVGLERGLGLNENLARELLELHTLGADGDYGQEDVEGMALLLTGASFTNEDGFVFRRRQAEPGEFTVLGRRYGGDKPRLADIEAALDDLARHPDTARHIARKLAAHFVADDPDPDLVEHIAARFTKTGGDLTEVYAAMLEHSSAWTPELRKVRPPYEFIATSIRALDVRPDMLLDMPPRRVGNLFADPLRRMGQPFHAPPDPSGWPDRADYWITPPALAARIQWSMSAPRALAQERDPRDMLAAVLGDAADEDLRNAAARAESRWDGVGIVLASPTFNRR